MVAMPDSAGRRQGGLPVCVTDASEHTFLSLVHLLSFQARPCQEARGLSQASDLGCCSPVLHSVTMVHCGESRAGQGTGLLMRGPLSLPSLLLDCQKSLNFTFCVFPRK